MGVCIYHPSDNVEIYHEEHVIPQSFGTFGPKVTPRSLDGTPVLRKEVCADCNHLFGITIDQTFARESLEGLTRYRLGLFSREARKQKLITLQLPKTAAMGEFANVKIWLDTKQGKLKEPLPQAHLLNATTGQYEVFLIGEINSLDWKSRGLLDKDIKIFGADQNERDEVVKELNSIGIQFNAKNDIRLDFVPGSKIALDLYGEINKTIQRAVAKILINFATFYIGSDEILKSNWDKARDYIYQGSGMLPLSVTQGAFWAQETNQIRMEPKGYNIAIRNRNKSIHGYAQFFNLFIYDFTLVDDYNLPADLEIALRFIPGEKPLKSIRLKNIILPNQRPRPLPIIGY